MTGELVANVVFRGEEPVTTSSLSLSLLISESSFSYLISADDSSKPLQLGEIGMSSIGTGAFDMQDRIAYLVNNNLLDQKKFGKVFISLLTPGVTLMPESFSSATDKNNLLSFSTGTKNEKTIAHSIAGINFNFPLKHALLQYLERTFPNAQIRHAGAVGLYLLQNVHTLQGADVHLVLHTGVLEIAARKGSSILFYNLFDVSGNEDVLYYLLFMMEQFGLDPQSTRVVFSGQKSHDDTLVKALKKYVRHFAFSVSDPAIRMTGDLRSMPSHYYFTLLNQHLCEL